MAMAALSTPSLRLSHYTLPIVPHSAKIFQTSRAIRIGKATFDNGSSSQQTEEFVSGSPTDGNGDENKAELAAKLAAAEAEAAALRKELAARKANADVDLAKLKPAPPEKRIDGMGYRETILSLKSTEQSAKWGLTEAELFLSKGAPTEGAGLQLGDLAEEEGAKEIVSRRLTIGIGIALAAIGLAFLKIPPGFIKPSKPLFFYVSSVIQLKKQLKEIEESYSDAGAVLKELQNISKHAADLRDNLISAAAWLDGADAEKATSLAYSIFGYLDQVDYKNYFQNLGQPSASQQLDFLRFSLQSVKAAQQEVEQFLSLIPSESLEAASAQAARSIGP